MTRQALTALQALTGNGTRICTDTCTHRQVRCKHGKEKIRVNLCSSVYHPIKLGRVALVIVTLVTLFSAPLAATANEAVRFTVIPKSAYTRAQPSLNAAKSFSVFKGLTYLVLAQDPTRTWVQIKIPPSQAGWVPLSYGTVSGDLNTVPIVTNDIEPATAQATPVPLPTQTSAGSNRLPAAGAASLNLTLTARSAFARSGPAMSTARLASLFKGQSFTALGRDSTASWVYIALPDGRRAWVSARAGKLSGNILSLPVAGEFTAGETAEPAAAAEPTAGPTATPTLVLTPPATLAESLPAFTPHMRQIYQRAVSYGLNPWVFTVAGDCNSEDEWYRKFLADGMVIPGPGYLHLQPVIERMRGMLGRKSLAARGSFSATSLLNPLWADPGICQPGEGPLACELRVSRASVIFISLGTGDHSKGQWESFEANYRPVIEATLKAGALPVLMTKSDELEFQEGGAPRGYLNAITRRLGQEYEIPVFDFALGAKALPNNGLVEEPGNDFHLSNPGFTLRNFGFLQMMYLLGS